MPDYARKGGDEEGGSGWLTTFGDMVTLLFTLFVLVYSFCSYNPGEWDTAVGSVKGALSVIPGRMGNTVVRGGGFGILPGHKGVVALFENITLKEEGAAAEFGQRMGEIQEAIKGIEGLELEETKTGFVFRISNPVLFPRASAEIRPSARPLLEGIGRSLKGLGASVIITGHTCDLPISTADYRSNWELSARRSTNVLRLIQAKAGDETRLVAVARGEYAPRVPNDSEESRAKNRRVEIKVDFTGGLPFES
jgi:chemotaxis protein MotB